MHIRLSMAIGLSIVDDHTDEELGNLSTILVHPETGMVEGILVRIPHLFRSEEFFVSAIDVVHWGAHIRVSGADALSPLEERVRLQAFVDEGRTLLDQKILTEGGAVLGTCKDVQFNTKTFQLEWLFPRKFLRWALAVPASSIIEVKPEGVIVRETALPISTEETPVIKAIEELAKTPTAG